MQEEDTKGQSSIRVKLAIVVSYNEFSKCNYSKTRSKESIVMILFEDGDLTNKDEEKADSYLILF